MWTNLNGRCHDSNARIWKICNEQKLAIISGVPPPDPGPASFGRAKEAGGRPLLPHPVARGICPSWASKRVASFCRSADADRSLLFFNMCAQELARHHSKRLTFYFTASRRTACARALYLMVAPFDGKMAGTSKAEATAFDRLMLCHAFGARSPFGLQGMNLLWIMSSSHVAWVERSDTHE